MKRMLAALAVLACSGLGVTADAGSPAPSTPSPTINLHPGAPPASRQLIDTLARQDRVLFDAVFGCKLEVLGGMLTDDFEFFHDKWGQTANYASSSSMPSRRDASGSGPAATSRRVASWSRAA